MKDIPAEPGYYFVQTTGGALLVELLVQGGKLWAARPGRPYLDAAENFSPLSWGEKISIPDFD